MTALRLHGVTKQFGRRTVLRDVDLEIHDGETVAVLGPNGAGKSTLLALAATAARPTAGTIEVAGIPARTGPEARARLSWCPQDPPLYPDLSPREHLRFWRRLHGSGDVDKLLEEAGLLRIQDRPCHVLSRGQRQRTALALALLPDVPLLLLDEPWTGLDDDGRRWLEDCLAARRGAAEATGPRGAPDGTAVVDCAGAAGGATLLAAHSEDLARRVADRVVQLRDHRLEAA